MANESSTPTVHAKYTGTGALPTDSARANAVLMPQFEYTLLGDSPYCLVKVNCLVGEIRKRNS
jgi:hypothetical protein